MKKNKPYLILFVILGLAIGQGGAGSGRPAAAQSGTFIDSGQLMIGHLSSAVALGDLDGDLDLDAFVVNAQDAHDVWTNQGGAQSGSEGRFLHSGQLLGLGWGMDVALGDLDGDNDLDAFVILNSYEDSNQIWINQGGDQGGVEGVFQANGQIIGDDLSNAVALGDLDSDGDLDAFVSRSIGRPSKVWLNDGSGNFSDSGQTLDTDSIDVALGDLDGDGDLDAFSANGAAGKIWLNQGGTQGGIAGVFQDSGQNLGSSGSNAVSLGDLDNDGDLDAYIAKAATDEVWINQGGAQAGTQGVFLDSGQSLSGGPAQSRAVNLGDVDNDGDLDVFLGKSLGNEVWINQGGDQDGTEGLFLDSGQSLGDAMTEGVALGDLDGDRDLDVFTANWYALNRVWLNAGKPAVWDSGYCNNQGLGSSDSTDIALADLDGDLDLDAFVTNWDQPNRIWMNDGGALGGTLGEFSDSGQSLGSARSQAVALGDLDGDFDLDAFVANEGANKVWINNVGVFSDSDQSLGMSQSQSVALGDLDDDGDLDAFIGNYGQPNKVWINQGGAQAGTPGQFSDSGQTLGGAKSFAVILGDLDDDGDLDSFVANDGQNKIWLNDGAGNFSDSGQTPGGSASVAVVLGDLDGDGDLDAIVGNAFNPTQVWLNDGTGSFMDSSQNLGDSGAYGLALGDVDGNSSLDIFIGLYDGPNKVWLNYYGTGIFTDSGQSLMIPGGGGTYAVALGDVDQDGDLDAFEASTDANVVWLNWREDTLTCVCSLEFLAAGGGTPSRAVANPAVQAFRSIHQATIDLETFYRLRDELLSQTPNGQNYIDLYGTHNPEILGLLVSNAALRDEGAATLELWQANLWALVNGLGDNAVITAGQVQAMDDFLTNLSTAGSPELQQAIAAERARLGNLDDFVGMDMDEARGVVVGYVVYLPMVQGP